MQYVYKRISNFIDVLACVDRSHGELNYHLIQVLSGHGCVSSFFYKIRHRAKLIVQIRQIAHSNLMAMILQSPDT